MRNSYAKRLINTISYHKHVAVIRMSSEQKRPVSLQVVIKVALKKVYGGDVYVLHPHVF